MKYRQNGEYKDHRQNISKVKIMGERNKRNEREKEKVSKNEMKKTKTTKTIKEKDFTFFVLKSLKWKLLLKRRN